MSNKISTKSDIIENKSNNNRKVLIDKKISINSLLQRISNGQSGVVLEELL
ncbi:hypothetical protein [Vibrio sp. AND4]|uniref:hypothetical protein n=1 Tax=Vibrio sp. AND4 TaxID=314289 RepID=UPI0016416F15|nr:hypothetical protein [Vibrio sp. AND4]